MGMGKATTKAFHYFLEGSACFQACRYDPCKRSSHLTMDYIKSTSPLSKTVLDMIVTLAGNGTNDRLRLLLVSCQCLIKPLDQWMECSWDVVGLKMTQLTCESLWINIDKKGLIVFIEIDDRVVVVLVIINISVKERSDS